MSLNEEEGMDWMIAAGGLSRSVQGGHACSLAENQCDAGWRAGDRMRQLQQGASGGRSDFNMLFHSFSKRLFLRCTF